ncbi:MAG TPA: H-type small acid-soluble spore protein [Mobilitalea sp.]|nr:H-type small acid-soluble spore protein [Mobilitalea sp.]
MDRKRATEIASSRETLDVTYNGRLIYIENVNPGKDTASIHYLNQPSFSQEVHLTHLVEAK